MVMAIFPHRTEPLMATNPSPCSSTEGLSMPEITSNSVPCCVTDIDTGRIYWEWCQGHWIIAEMPDSAAVPKRHKADRQG